MSSVEEGFALAQKLNLRLDQKLNRIIMGINPRTSLQVPPTSYVPNAAQNAAFFERKDQVDNISAPNNAEGKKKSAYDPSIYVPHWITGGAKHPGLIVETPRLANVAPPPITYRPYLPKHLSEKGLMSSFQTERIIYAGQSHEQRLANGARAGISIGDGTGTGKTATLAGIILDKWFCGRRKTVRFSVKPI